MAPTAGSPVTGTYILKLAPEAGDISFYREGSTEESDVLVTMPPGGVAQVEIPSTSKPQPPHDFVLIRVRFWVKKELVEQVLGTWRLKVTQNDWACWSVPQGEASQSGVCGMLLPKANRYSAGNTDPQQNGDWRLVELLVWVKQENIEPKQ
jgi:hypothetical protein